MNCVKCNSERVLSLDVKQGDCGRFGMGRFEHYGYAPEIKNICGGDYTKLSVCLDCGQVQGKFPAKKTVYEGDVCLCDIPDIETDDYGPSICANCGELAPTKLT